MALDVLSALAADVDALAAAPVAALSVSQLMELVEATAPLAARLDGVVCRAVGNSLGVYDLRHGTLLGC